MASYFVGLVPTLRVIDVPCCLTTVIVTPAFDLDPGEGLLGLVAPGMHGLEVVEVVVGLIEGRATFCVATAPGPCGNITG